MRLNDTVGTFSLTYILVFSRLTSPLVGLLTGGTGYGPVGRAPAVADGSLVELLLMDYFSFYKESTLSIFREKSFKIKLKWSRNIGQRSRRGWFFKRWSPLNRSPRFVWFIWYLVNSMINGRFYLTNWLLIIMIWMWWWWRVCVWIVGHGWWWHWLIHYWIILLIRLQKFHHLKRIIISLERTKFKPWSFLTVNKA